MSSLSPAELAQERAAAAAQMRRGAAKPKRPPVTVRVEAVEGAPIDLDAWLREYLEAVMETEGILPEGEVEGRSVG